MVIANLSKYIDISKNKEHKMDDYETDNYETGNSKVSPIIAILAIVMAAATTGAVMLNQTKAEEFNEEATASTDVKNQDDYVRLENYDIELPELSAYYNEEIKEKIIVFFTNLRPDITYFNTTNLNTERIEPTKSDDNDGEEEALGLLETWCTTFVLEANSGEKFNVRIINNKYEYELWIYDASGNEIFHYNSTEVTQEPRYGITDDFIEAIGFETPYSSQLTDGSYFTVFYDGDDLNRLTIVSGSEDDDFETPLSASACKEATQKAVSWANHLNLEYPDEITDSFFICE